MRILLIEDHDVLGDAVRDFLASLGFVVDWTKTIESSAAILKLEQYVLILLDLNLPDGNGIDFLKSLRESGDLTPVIVTSARDSVSDKAEARLHGASDYLVKPFQLNFLAERIAVHSQKM